MHLFSPIKRIPVLFLTVLAGCSQVSTKPLSDLSACHSDVVELLVQQKILAPEGLSNSEKPIGYKAGCADLNGDGRQEIFVLMQSLWFCGTGGCSAFIFDNQGNELSQMSVTDEPVLLSDNKNNGWRAIYVWSDGAMRKMNFDGEKYPGNPSMQPVYHNEHEIKAAHAKAMASEIYQQDGHQLKLVRDVPIFQPAHLYTFSFLHYGDPTVEYLMTVNMKTNEQELTTRPLAQTH
ncbi:hypothetical protein [Endozoicomonas ascidiicola]|uniref:hypothetical protein n=1 Tax=Endozoicomonas ascidiicola TaxID=1698521 RepID=UPI000ABAAECD|nr:hypothetical protein [Endozoicomonas ascidiicola]